MANYNNNGRPNAEGPGQQGNGQRNAMASNATPMNCPSAAFNCIGLEPTEARFQISKTDFQKYVMELATSFSKDFVTCTIQADTETKVIKVFAWIKSDSPDVIDNRLKNNDNVVIHTPIIRISNQIRSFIFSFCEKGIPDSKRFLMPESGYNLLGLELSLGRLVAALFDSNGKIYAQVQNTNQRFQPSEVEVMANTDKFGGVRSFTVRKMRRATRDLNDLRPRRSHRLDD